jgi:inhibitor of KinA
MSGLTTFTGISPLGDRALSIRFRQEISAAVHRDVMACQDALTKAVQEAKGGQGPLTFVTDIVPSYAALLVVFDPLKTNCSQMTEEIDKVLGRIGSAGPARTGGRLVLIPVLYGKEEGPDLSRVARMHNMTEAEVIRLHCRPVYPVYMLGFLAGFPYLGGMDPDLATPRLETPRTGVPAGSVGIAGAQTGIYPIASPGGWNLIGRTELVLYDPDRKDPFLIHPGDRVKFTDARKAKL